MTPARIEELLVALAVDRVLAIEEGLKAKGAITPLGVRVSTVGVTGLRQYLVHLDAEIECGGQLEHKRTAVSHCGECGERLGEGAQVVDERTATHRGTAGSVEVQGCETCCEWIERRKAGRAA